MILSQAEQKAVALYDALPDHLKSDMIEAAIWARETLTKHEGSGHHFELIAHDYEGTLSCNFAKAEWAGDHSGSYMGTAAEAICIAVCEYLGGM